MQYLLFMYPNENATFFQNKANKLIDFFKNKELSKNKFSKILKI